MRGMTKWEDTAEFYRFPIASVSKEDLEARGFDVSLIDGLSHFQPQPITYQDGYPAIPLQLLLEQALLGRLIILHQGEPFIQEFLRVTCKSVWIDILNLSSFRF